MEINLNEKRKKGRPRKENANYNPLEIVLNNPSTNVVEKEDEKKKRGRKKKEVVEEEIKIKKKRGRKAALKYFSSSIRKQMPLKTDIIDNENGILFLDIKDKDLEANNIDNVDNFLFGNSNSESISTEMQSVVQSVNTNTNDDSSSCSELNQFFNTNSSVNNTTNCGSNGGGGSINYKPDQVTLQKDNIKKGFFKVLDDFNSEWCEKTNVKCWWCCHNFDTLPLGMPVSYDYKLKKYNVRGVFCSFACMLAYTNNTKGLQPKRYLINYLYKKLTGVFGINFKEAPSKYILKEFGGLLTIEEFRKLSSEHKSYKMIEYPMHISRDFIAEVDLVNIKQVNTKVFNNVSRVIELDDKKVEDAKLRISKIENNVVTLSNTIEDFIKN
jgi:hypothetical protein